MKTLLDKFVIESILNILKSKGYKLSYDQTLEQIKTISNFNHTQQGLYHLWTMYNTDPPEPPYKYYFESQDEAMIFADKAKKKHKVKCNIDLIDFRKWKLTSKKKRTKNGRD